MKDLQAPGSYITLRELIDEVGRDAVRFFLRRARPTPSSCSTSTSPSRSPKRPGLLRPVRPRAHLLGDGAMEGPVRRRAGDWKDVDLARSSARASWDYSSAWGIRGSARERDGELAPHQWFSSCASWQGISQLL